MRTWPGLGLVMKRWRASPGRISSEVLGTPELSSCQPIDRAPPFSADPQRSLRLVKGVHHVGGCSCPYSPNCRILPRETVWKIRMRSTLWSHESADQGERDTFCRFALPNIRDPDPFSYFPNSFRRSIPGNRASGIPSSRKLGELEVQEKGRGLTARPLASFGAAGPGSFASGPVDVLSADYPASLLHHCSQRRAFHHLSRTCARCCLCRTGLLRTPKDRSPTGPPPGRPLTQ